MDLAGVHYLECVSGIKVVSQPFCVDKLNPAGLISVRATLPIYLIDQVSSLQRRAERRDGKFKTEDQKHTCFYKIVY